MSCQPPRWILFALVLLTALALGVPPAGASHLTGIFQLDGDPVSSGGVDDWDVVLLGGGGGSTTALGPIPDHTPADTIFTGGGSKDQQDITAWRWVQRSPPDKDELTNAYAAGYTLGGQQLLYFGADRFDTSGDAQMGFWFFRSPVSLNPNGTFSGTHSGSLADPSQPRDFLVLSNFLQGGTVAVIEVYEWVGSGGSHGEVNLLASATQAGTSVCTAGDEACAITNAVTVPAPWPYVDKDGSTSFQPRAFIEGGINLSALGLEGCVASFVAETRSSQSITATLKDFVLGTTFNTCGITASKVCTAAVNSAGNAVTVSVSGQVCNAAPIQVTNVTVVDDHAGTLLSGATLAAQGQPGDCVDYSGSYTSSTTSNTDTVTATGDAGGTQVSATASASCAAPVSPAIAVNKVCTAAINTGGNAVDVSFSGQVCNTGNVELSGVALVNDKPAPNTPVPLADTTLSPGECVAYNGTYTSASAANSDTVNASGNGALGAGSVQGGASANCEAALNPGISVTKACETDLQVVNNTVAVLVNFAGQVCNTGNVQLNNVTLTNTGPGASPSVPLSDTTLSPGECVGYSSSYTPNNISAGSLQNPGSTSFTDTVTASGSTAVGSSPPPAMATATCPLCPSP